MERQGKETRQSRGRKLLQNKQIEDKNSRTDELNETLKTIVTHQLETLEEKCDDDCSDGSKKVGSRVDKKALTAFWVSRYFFRIQRTPVLFSLRIFVL